MNILIEVLVAGLAVGYVVEFVSSLLARWVPAKIIKLFITIPLSVVALMILGMSGTIIFVTAPASSFVALVIMLWAAKPVEVTQVVNRR
jgi:hypothetical protein